MDFIINCSQGEGRWDQTKRKTEERSRTLVHGGIKDGGRTRQEEEAMEVRPALTSLSRLLLPLGCSAIEADYMVFISAFGSQVIHHTFNCCTTFHANVSVLVASLALWWLSRPTV